MNNFLQRFTVGKRMFAGFGLMLALSAVIAATSLTSLSTVEGHLEQIAGERVTKTRLANLLYDAANEMNLNLQALLLVEGEDRIREVQTAIAGARQAFSEAYEQLQAMPAREEGRKALAAVGAARELAAPPNDEVIALAAAGRKD